MSIIGLGILLLLSGLVWKSYAYPKSRINQWLQEGVLAVGLALTLYGVYLNYVAT